jgi:hypothetical protein
VKRIFIIMIISFLSGQFYAEQSTYTPGNEKSASTGNTQGVSIDYLGQKQPGYYPEKFGEGFFKPNEWGPVFSPDGDELFYTSQNPDGSQKYHINYMKKSNGVWSKPMMAPFSDKSGSAELEPNFTPDGKKLYYDSERKGGLGGADIWYVTKTDNGWSEPINAGDGINTKNNDNFAFFTEDGSMYFCSDRNKSSWDIDIYYSKFIDGKYLPAKKLDESINSSSWDSCPTVAKNKLLFNSSRSGGFGKGDIYFCEISGDSWGKPETLSANYNSKLGDWGLVLSPDKKYFFFYQQGSGIYWVDSEALDYIGVKQEPINYIASWYSGNRDQMEQALHPKLAKRRVNSSNDVSSASYDWMLNAVENGKGRITDPKSGQKDIEILSQSENMASVKVISNDFIDYLQLAKFNNKWKIINALWEYKSTKSGGIRSTLEQTLADYVQGWKTGNKAQISGILHKQVVNRKALSLTEVDNYGYDEILDKVGKHAGGIYETMQNIEILDFNENMASARIFNIDSVEFIHLRYVENKWLIVNSLRNF